MSKLHVAYICNDVYMPMTGVSIYSLLEHNKNAESIDVYLAGDEISQENMKKISGLIDKYGRGFHYIDSAKICRQLESKGIKKHKGKTYSPYLKNLITAEVDKDAERLLYIDSDTVINGSLEELFEMELEKPLYMVIDAMWDFYKRKLGMEDKAPYYNGGIILYNMPVWKKEHCYRQYWDFLKNSPRQYVLGDQDITNILFSRKEESRNKIGLLDLKYNYYSNYYLLNRKLLYPAVGISAEEFYSAQDMEKADKEAVVYHCAKYNGERPWEEGNEHPFRSIYEHYKEKSPWSDAGVFEKRHSGIIAIQIRLEQMLPRFLYIPVLRAAQKYYFYKEEKKLNS